MTQWKSCCAPLQSPGFSPWQWAASEGLHAFSSSSDYYWLLRALCFTFRHSNYYLLQGDNLIGIVCLFNSRIRIKKPSMNLHEILTWSWLLKISKHIEIISWIMLPAAIILAHNTSLTSSVCTQSICFRCFHHHHHKKTQYIFKSCNEQF